MQTLAKPDVFISYAKEDRSFAELVKGYLLARDRSVWSDEEIRPGEDFQEAIARSLEASRAVILVLSPAFLRSSINLYEAGIALAKEQHNEGKLIPIVIGDIDLNNLPPRLRRSKLVDARGTDQRNMLQQVDKLLAG